MNDFSFRMKLLGALVAAVLIIPVTYGHAESISTQDQTAIADVIGSQMDAFQRDDAEGAFTFAAPSIRSKFQSADIFMQMVAKAYAPVYRPNAVKFLDVVEHGGSIMQRVWIEGPDGKPVIAIYVMGQQPDGTWRIRGVRLVEPDGTSV